MIPRRSLLAVLFAVGSLAASSRLLAAPAQGSVSGLVFHDANANGAQDAGETGLVGWTVTLTEVGNPANVQTTTTDPAGGYFFGNVTSGTYQVRVQPLPGWSQTTLMPADVHVGTSGNSAGGDFGFASVVEVPTLQTAGLAALALALLVLALRLGRGR